MWGPRGETGSFDLRRRDDAEPAVTKPKVLDEIGASARLSRWLIEEKQSRWELPGRLRYLPHPCHPADVCREWNGDLNPKYFKDPNVLGEFRKIFEPKWKQTVENIHVGQITAENKLIVAGYWAHLATCTLAWRRICATTYEGELRKILPIVTKDMEVPSGLEIDRIRIEIEGDFIKSLVTKWLLPTTALLYHGTWTIFDNDTGYEFLTSDNPSAIIPKDDPNQWSVRVLQISPRLCLSAVLDNAGLDDVDTDILKPPRGTLSRCRIDSARVKIH